MSIDLDTLLYACQVAIPGAIVSGTLGFFIGRIFENARGGKHSHRKSSTDRNSDLLIDDLLMNDLDGRIE